MSKNLISDLAVSACISGTVVFGFSFGYHNIQNANLYLSRTHNTPESYNRHKGLLYTTSVLKGVIFGLAWPISSGLYYLRDNKLAAVCPLYYAQDYRQFYDQNAKYIRVPS